MSQLVRDYRHYPEDPEHLDMSGFELRYGEVMNLVIFFYGGADPAWVAKDVYEFEQKWLVGEGAKPLTPPCEIQEMADVRYRNAWHHDGMHEETYYRPYEEYQ